MLRKLFGIDGAIDWANGWLRIGRHWFGFWRGRFQWIPVIAGGTSANTTQEDFWFRNDDGSLTTATYMGSQNSDQTIGGNVVFRIRIIAEENNGKTDPWAFQIYAQKNGSGGYTAVTTSRTDGLQYSDDANSIADGATIGTADFDLTWSGTPIAGEYDDAQSSAGTGTIGLNGSYTEIEFCLVLNTGTGNVNNGDYWDLRMYSTGGTALDGYTRTPRVTASVAHSPLVAAYHPFSITGQITDLLASRLLTAGQGSFTLTGYAAGLTGPAANLIEINHEDNDFSEYTGIQQDGSDLAVSAGAALAGTNYGLSVTVNDVNNIFGYVTLGTPDASGVMRMRFYLDPNGISMASGWGNYIFNCKRASGGSDIGEVYLLWSGTSYQLFFSLYDDVSSTDSSNYNITDAPHYIDVLIVRATTSGSADGYMSMWVDGVLKETISGKDNYDTFDQLGYLKWGCTYGARSDTSGTYYIDEIIVNNTGDPIGPAALIAGQGSFTITGQATSLLASRLLDGDQGSFTLSGQVTGLFASRLVEADQGSFTLSGQAVGFQLTKYLGADQGAFTLAGQVTGFQLTKYLGAGQGSFTLTGFATGLAKTFSMVAGSGSFTFTGSPSNLLLARILEAGQGSFTLTGFAAGIAKTFTLAADQGSFTLTGYDAGLTRTRVLLASQGSFTLTGYDAGLQKIGAYELIAEVGSFTLSGQAVGLLATRSLAAGQGSFTLSGQVTGFTFVRTLAAGQGTFTLAGQDTGLFVTRSLAAGQGSFTLTGSAAGLTKIGSYALMAAYHAFAIAGQDAGLYWDRLLTAGLGTFTLTGQAMNFSRSYRLVAGQGSFTLTGIDASLIYSLVRLILQQDAYLMIELERDALIIQEEEQDAFIVQEQEQDAKLIGGQG